MMVYGERNTMGFFSRKKKSPETDPSKPLLKTKLRMAKSAGRLAAGEVCTVSIYRDMLDITSIDMNASAKLMLDKVTNVRHVRDLSKIQSGSLGRAIAGGALFGGAGAVVGAMTSGKKVVSMLAIDYMGRDGNGSQLLLFEDSPNGTTCENVASILQMLCGLEAQSDYL